MKANNDRRYRQWLQQGEVQTKDLHSFCLEVSYEDARVIANVKERVRQQERLWWALEARRGAGWYLQPILSATSLVSSLSLATVGNALQLRKLVRKGIPPSLRPRIWLSLSGAAKKRSAAPHSYYADLLDAVKDRTTGATQQIDHDLDRTFPAHPWMNSNQGQQVLRRVLVAYSFRDSRVGYCQGMNFIAGLLLLVMKTEEDAFWMLAVLLEDVLLKDTYSDTLYGFHVEQRVFKDLMKKKCPRLTSHLDALDFDVSMLTAEWFLCLFAKSLPSETTMRIWDILYAEGVKAVFRIALAIFKAKEDELLRVTYVDEVVKIMKDFTGTAFDPEVIFKVAYEKFGTIPMETISKQRRKQQPVVMAEMAERLRRSSSLSP